MSDIRTLLSCCRALGAEFTPTAEGKLKVWAPAPLPENLQAELKRRKAEVIAALTVSQTPLLLVWLHDGRMAGEPGHLLGALRLSAVSGESNNADSPPL